MGSSSKTIIFTWALLMGITLPQLVDANSVEVSKSCYTPGEQVTATFENLNPQPFDWLGIYVSETPTSALPNLSNARWIFNCGSQSCGGTPSTGTVTFPINPGLGSFRVYMARNSQTPPWFGFARSDAFSVMQTCPDSPAPPPTRPPTASPTPLPSPSPTPMPQGDANAALTTDKSLYQLNEPIVVSFAILNPQVGDWIGIYPANTPSNNIQTGELWLWHCDRQSPGCGSAQSSGSVTFEGGKVIAWAGVWPLQPLPNVGWKAVLLRNAQNSNGSWVLLAQSGVFRVQAASATPMPVTVLTPMPVAAPVTAMPTPMPTPATPAPTRAPTSMPTPATPAPTPMPTPATPMPTPATPAPTPLPQSATGITTNQVEYRIGESITVTFSNQNPQTNDWIGIYPGNTSPNNVQTGEFWLWHCGQQGQPGTCAGPQQSGSVTFDGDTTIDWAGSWPLQPRPNEGWKAILLRNDFQTGAWGFVAQSNVFQIVLGPAEMAIAAARRDIEALISSRPELGAKFLRLIFHDCVGDGCDGCVDLTNPENGGLLDPITVLRTVEANHAGPGRMLSRADIWALAALVGCDVAQGPQRIDFPLMTIGRVNCEDVKPTCDLHNGNTVNCRDVRDDDHFIPGPTITTHDLFQFFLDEFGYTTQQTVAIMGAHTIGQLATENSGIDGESGWLLNNELFDNEYYAEIVGGSSANDNINIHIDGAPNWQRDIEQNNNNPFPPIHLWTGFPQGTKIIMLNADIAIVRDLNDSNMASNGRVSCNFVGAGRCPVAQQSFQFAVDYTFDNLLWLNDFKEALGIMINDGYDIVEPCGEFDVCQLTRSTS